NGVRLALRIALQAERLESVDNLRGRKGCARDDSREIRVFEFYHHSLLRVVGSLDVIVNQAEQQVNLRYEYRKCEEARNGARKEENIQVKKCYGRAEAYLKDLLIEEVKNETGHQSNSGKVKKAASRRLLRDPGQPESVEAQIGRASCSERVEM